MICILIGGFIMLKIQEVYSVKVKVNADFRDRENDLRLRKAGEQFDVKNDRAEQLSELGLVEILPDKAAEEKKG